MQEFKKDPKLQNLRISTNRNCSKIILFHADNFEIQDISIFYLLPMPLILVLIVIVNLIKITNNYNFLPL